MAWQIIRTSLNFIINNFAVALRVTILPYTAYFAFLLVVDTSEFAQQSRFSSLAGVLAALFFGAWMAVGWHRYILIGDTPKSWMPGLHGQILRGYMVKLFLLAVVLIFSAVPFILFAFSFMQSVPIITNLSFVLIPFVVGLFFFRFGLVLPATALDQPLSFGKSWRATQEINGAVLVTIVFVTVFNGVLASIGAAMPFGPVSILWAFAAGWVQAMLGLSILTTLYGHLIEKRDLY